jgi:hypothetical protein
MQASNASAKMQGIHANTEYHQSNDSESDAS